MSSKKLLFLFDVDGTLTPPRLPVESWMVDFLTDLKTKHAVGFVGGSDISKQIEQLGEHTLQLFHWAFAENGLRAWKDSVEFHHNSIKKELSEDQLKEFINFCLHYIADLDLPVKRGTFVEFRSGMLNVSPIGRNCSQEERIAFNELDQQRKIREAFIAKLRERFPDLALSYSIGGQISFDVFPTGWDKRYCLQFLEKEGFDEIHFFGDKTAPGGNDHEIFEDPRTIGHTVTSPAETKRIIDELLAGAE